MNRINPIHIAILIVAILVFVMFKLSMAKNESVEVKALYQETLELSTQLKGFNEIYSDKNSVLKAINKILKQPSLRSANINKKLNKSSVELSSDSIDKVALNSLMSKLLNGSYNILSCKIKRLNEKSATVKVGIKW